jgi:hypothetical protein
MILANSILFWSPDFGLTSDFSVIWLVVNKKPSSMLGSSLVHAINEPPK